ncbi:MAG: T9SS type A sorting domain-containing protein [Calditrichia bacterium]
MNKFAFLIIICIVLCAMGETICQTKVERDVLPSGGAYLFGGGFSAHVTAGQGIIGRGSIANQKIAAGFWHTQPLTPPLKLSQLPLSAGAGVATVWNDDVYFFGGGTHWWGQTFHQTILKLQDGQWLPVGSIPDNNTWDMTPVLLGDALYLLDGWNGGEGLVRSYEFDTGNWRYHASSPNWVDWGNTAQIVNNQLYLFTPAGRVYQYSLADSTWMEKSPHNILAFNGMRSVVHNGEIYIIGFRDGGFYKYDPSSNQMSQLADPPYQVAGCAVQLYRGKIFCVGGSPEGNPGLNNYMYRSVISYDFSSDSWQLEPLGISDSRTFMASVVYEDEFYVFGGFDSLSLAVNTVEKLQPRVIVGIDDDLAAAILPEKLKLENNYPNPFNPTTTIRFGLPTAADVRLEIFNMLGQRIRVLVNAPLQAGWHNYVWSSQNDYGTMVASGVYVYRLTTGSKVIARKLMLLR